jgi:hypothetical protein
MRHDDHHAMNKGGSPYLMLGLNLLLSGIVMYFAMFSMIDGLQNFFHNLNMFYMALVMLAPMAVLMVLMMRMMYPNKTANLSIIGAAALVFVGAFVGIRQQAAIGNEQFLRSMIPHHAGAILMCRRAQITDPEIKSLCGEIISSQRQEIAQMKRILAREEP